MIKPVCGNCVHYPVCKETMGAEEKDLCHIGSGWFFRAKAPAQTEEWIVLAVVKLLREHYFRPGQNHPDATETVEEITNTLRRALYIDWTVNQSNQHMEEVLGL